jgi:perosamine synthetase
MNKSVSPFIPTSEPVLDGNEKKYVLEAFERNWISAGGKYTLELEEKWAKYVGMKYGVACSNGTTAIHLAITALGLQPGDEIIIPDFTIICSASMPILAGLKPVLVDVDEYWCMDPERIEEKITSKTKAIMPVHMYGNSANMEPILKIAKKHNLLVIEDACAAHGAEVDGKKVGSMGDVSCFSFYASKNVTSGEGGMILTNNKDIADYARSLRSQGFEKIRFIHRYLGFNYRMTDIQAAIAVAQVENIDKKIAKRREIAKYYTELLKDIPEIEIHKGAPWGKSTFWMFGVLIKDSFGRSRDEIIELMHDLGIGTERFYTPMSKQPVFIKGGDARYPDITGAYPVSQNLGACGLYLPSGLGITKKDQDRVVKAFLSLRIKGARMIKPTFLREDDRGTFVEALNSGEWKNVSFGTMEKGAVMGNHYHKKTSVFFYLTRGSASVNIMNVVTKEVNNAQLNTRSGLIFSPDFSHSIKFLEKSDFVMGKSIEYNSTDPDTFPLQVPDVK